MVGGGGGSREGGGGGKYALRPSQSNGRASLVSLAPERILGAVVVIRVDQASRSDPDRLDRLVGLF